LRNPSLERFPLQSLSGPELNVSAAAIEACFTT
jgi:hypothetical protein